MTRRRRKNNAAQWSSEAPSQSGRDMPAEAKLHDIFDRANDSERYGMKFGLFPSWVKDYELSNNEFAQLITIAQENP